MPISNVKRNRFGRSQKASDAVAVTASTVRVFYEPNNLDVSNGKPYRSVTKLTVPVDGFHSSLPSAKVTANKKKTGLVNSSRIMGGVWLSPTQVNNISAEDYELLQEHPDFEFFVETGVLRIVKPRQVPNPANPKETINSATGTTLDFDLKHALEIVNKSCDPRFLELSAIAEQGALSSDESRGRILDAISKRKRQLQNIINTRLASNGSRALNTRGAKLVG